MGHDDYRPAEDPRNWGGLLRQFVTRNLKVYAYTNNHYALPTSAYADFELCRIATLIFLHSRRTSLVSPNHKSGTRVPHELCP